MADYDYEIFLSYHRGERWVPGGAWALEQDGEWVHQVFFPEFKHWMGQEYPGVRIAFDRDLPTGTDWNTKLREWLCRSRCLVAVWNAPYFRSGFCRSEFRSMLQRQQELASRGIATPELVLPIVYHDGEWFEPDARTLQFSKKFSEFSSHQRRIKGERTRRRFTAAIQELCIEVKRSIQSAPPFQDDFPWCEVTPLPPAHAYAAPSLQRATPDPAGTGDATGAAATAVPATADAGTGGGAQPGGGPGSSATGGGAGGGP